MDKRLLGKLLVLASLADAVLASMLLSSKDEDLRLVGQVILPMAPAWLVLGVRLLSQG